MVSLASCATLPDRAITVPPVENDIPFTIDARLAIQHRDEAVFVKVIWRHLINQDTITIFSPFGHQLATIERFDSHYSLIRAGEVRVVTDNVAQLTEGYFGYSMPISQLPTWLLGVLVKDHVINRDVLPYNLTTPDGWQLRYEEFMEAQQRWLPRKVLFVKDNTSARFVIDRWLLGENK